MRLRAGENRGKVTGHRRRSRSDGRRRGFALILALALMAFLVLLLVSLSTLSQIEINAAGTARKQFTAQQNALLGLQIALGELQRNVGPDQRATARAEILGEDMANPYWTGVWPADEGSADTVVWLVSGTERKISVDPTATPGDTVLVGENTANKEVRVSKMPIFGNRPPGEVSNASVGRGHYAYWVSDEGLKASVAQIDKTTFLDASVYSPLVIQRNRQLASGSFGLVRVFGGDYYDPFAASVSEGNENFLETAKALTKSKSAGNLQFVDGISPEELKEAYFDITRLAVGVLTDPERGGLKRDLSDPEFQNLSGPVPINEAAQRFLRNRTNANDKVEIVGIDSDDYDADQRELVGIGVGDPYFTTPIIPTELVLYAAAFRKRKTGNNIGLFLAVRGDFWTPYSMPLAFSGEEDTPEAKIRFKDLPDVTLRYFTVTEDGTQTFRNQVKTVEFDTLNPNFDVDFSDTMKAGEVRFKSTVWEANSRTDYYHPSWNWEITDATPSDRGDDFIFYSMEASNVHIEIFDRNDNILQIFKNVPFEKVPETDELNKNAFVDSASRVSLSDYPVRFRFWFLDEISDVQLWSSRMDPRSLQFDFQDTDGERRALVNELIEVHEPSSIEEDFRWEEFFGGHFLKRNYFRLFDLPSQDPISVGALQHLALNRVRPLSIGNPWGGIRNEVYDRYFFSTVPRESDSWKPGQELPEGPELGAAPLLNSRLILFDPDRNLNLDDLRSEDSARHFLISGAFNINSTSLSAWKALLSSSNLRNWKYRNSNGEVRMRDRLWNAFFRLPFGADRNVSRRSFGDELVKYPAEYFSGYPAISNVQKREWFKLKLEQDNPATEFAPSWSLGVRELTDEEVDQLAEKIVDRIRAKGEPFRSIKEFLNDPSGGDAGPLQEAIDATSLNSLLDANYLNSPPSDRIPRHATAFLSQADVVRSIASFASTRSDTFLIRAYGDTQNRVTGEIGGRAWCEALAQRVPTLVDGIEGDIMAKADSFGRRFRLLYFRWLDASDI